MTDQGSRALRLADEFEATKSYMGAKAAAELRRLHEVNAELVEALQQISNYGRKDGDIIAQHLAGIARAAIAKATGEQP